MKKGWELKTLGAICLFENGDRGKNYPSKSIQTTSGIPFINAGHLTDFGIDYDNMNYIPKERFELLGNGKIRKYDILFCLRGSLGKFSSVGKLSEGAIASSLVIIRPKESVMKEYILAYLQSDLCSYMINKFKNGAAQPNLSAGSLKKFSIPVPPLPEQQRIVGILDKAFEGIATAKANAEKNLRNAREIFESHLQKVFAQKGEGWVEKRLGELTKKIGSGATPRGGEKSYKQEGISLIRSLNVHDLGFKYTKLAFLNDSQADDLSNVEVKRYDVLLNITGASVARCCIVPENVLPARVNQHVSIIRPISDMLDSEFLHYLLISKPYKDLLLQTGEEGGSTRQAITKAQIQDFNVMYPKMVKEQLAISAKLDTLHEETQRLESIYKKKIDALEELKKSLLHRAFNGEL